MEKTMKGDIYMRISDLEKKYPNIKFYKLKLKPQRNFYIVEKIEDFAELVSVAGYVEIEINEEDARNDLLVRLISAYIENMIYPRSIDTVSRNLLVSFFEYVKENMSIKLKNLIENITHTVTNLYLYGIDAPIMFGDEEEDSNLLSEDEYDKGIGEIEKIYNKYNSSLKKEQEDHDKEINDCILSYKEEYLQAETKTAKDEILKKVKMELKRKFNLDGRGDDRAKKIAIKMLYENNN